MASYPFITIDMTTSNPSLTGVHTLFAPRLLYTLAATLVLVGLYAALCYATGALVTQYDNSLQASYSSPDVTYTPDSSGASSLFSISEIGRMMELEVLAFLTLGLTFFRQVSLWIQDGKFPATSALRATLVKGTILNFILLIAFARLAVLLFGIYLILLVAFFVLVVPLGWVLSRHMIPYLFYGKEERHS